MDSTQFLPVLAKPCQRISLADATYLVLICDYIYLQTRDLLLITRVFEIRIEDSVWRDQDLSRRCQFAGTGSQRIDSLDRIVCQNRSETVLYRKIPAVHGRMVTIKSCQFGHHLYLASLDLRITEIVILIHSPSGTHKHLHSMLGGGIHDRIDRTLAPLRIVLAHQFRRIIGLPFIRHRHEYKIFHPHLLHFRNLRLPHQRIGHVKILRVCIFVTDILIRKIDESSCNREHIAMGLTCKV